MENRLRLSGSMILALVALAFVLSACGRSAHPHKSIALNGVLTEEMIRADQSDKEKITPYQPSPQEIATREEFEAVVRNQGSRRDVPDAYKPYSTGEFTFNAKGGLEAPANRCNFYLDRDGYYNSYGRIIRNYILDEVSATGDSLYLSPQLVGMRTEPNICPNWRSLSRENKIKFWVWAFAAIAYEESSCNIEVKDAKGPNDSAVGLYQLEKKVANRAWRGANCRISESDLRKPMGNIRCAMDMIKTELTPSAKFKRSGALYSNTGSGINSYFQKLNDPKGGDIGQHIRAFAPCFDRGFIRSARNR